MKRKTRKGFTLIELIIVVAIIAVLSALLAVTISGFIDKARKKSLLANGKTIWNAAALALTDDAASKSFYTPQSSWTLFEGKPNGRAVMVTTSSTSTGISILHADKVTNKKAKLRGEGNYLFTIVTRVDGYNHGSKGSDRGDSVQITNVFNTWNYSDKRYEVFVKKFCNLLNMSLGIKDKKDFPVSMPYTKRDDGGYHALVRWLVCYRLDNREVEVWAGDGYKAENGPVYRVYPNPCDFFLE